MLNKTLRFDENVHAFLPGGAVNDDGDPIAIALDLNTGQTWKKVAKSMPWTHGRSHTEAQAGNNDELTSLIDQGAIYHAADNQHFRGVWVPLDDQEGGAEDIEDAGGDANATPVQPELAAPTPRPAAAKKAAKKKPNKR